MLQKAGSFSNWSAIESVFVDMDGTLLDLHFDNHFWREYLPQRYGEGRGLSLEQAQAELRPRFRAMQGTLQWYCLDHWSRELGMDILALHREQRQSIRVLPQAEEFLRRTRARGKRLVLVTNAHPDTLALKMEQTRLDAYFDRMVTSHILGAPKETTGFWQALAQVESFDPAATLLADDSLPVLRAARNYGLHHLVAMRRPDSHGPAREVEEFPAVESLAELMP
jgi:HAD superfamily hydrolase (TIGR01509 family)